MFSTRNRARQDLQLRITRFRKLLEDSRRLLELLGEANETYQGDYIFDRQYIVSLVSKAIEQAGKLVFHAHVLAPDGSDMLYKMYDACKRSAWEQLSSSARSRQKPEAGRRDARPALDSAAAADGGAGKLPGGEQLEGTEPDRESIPEFKMLAQVIHWLSGPSPAGDHSVLDLLDRVMDQVIGSLEVIRDLKVATRPLSLMGTGNECRVELADLECLKDWAGAVAIPSQDLHCKPLELMILGAGDASLAATARMAPEAGAAPGAAITPEPAAAPGATAPHRTTAATGASAVSPSSPSSRPGARTAWLAAVGEDQLSLSSLGSGAGIYLDATLTGHAPADHVFVFWRGGQPDRSLLPAGFTLRTTARGVMGWSFDVPYRDLEAGLIRLGRAFWGRG